MKCIHCGHPRTYELGSTQRKCPVCRRKFSVRKIEREATLRRCFDGEMTATAAAASTRMHIATVLRYYAQFRREAAWESEQLYRAHADRIDQYDEYFYLPATLKPEEHIAQIRHFLTQAYGRRVYNLLLPDLPRYGTQAADQKRLLKYLRYTKVAKLSSEHTVITEFWGYFEKFMTRFRGVSDAEFPYYLKEAEWRFNRAGLAGVESAPPWGVKS